MMFVFMFVENGMFVIVCMLSDLFWVEVKWDGICVIGMWVDGWMLLYVCCGIDIMVCYFEFMVDGVLFFFVFDVVVDGEIVVFDV